MRRMRAEEPGGPDISQVEELVPLVPTHIVSADVHGTRAGRGRGRFHSFSLQNTPFISTINGVALILHVRLIQHRFTHSEDMPSLSHHLQPYFLH